ncbi:MFS transporter [Streptomyces sp. NPDC059224]|uniref:MFS transporter n=1 Tax=Streptomyces sp. NPDC059224 TaxID=3346775 RepID=UPI00369EB1AE
MASPPRPVPGPSRSVTPPPSRSAAGGPRRPALSVGVACLAIFCAYVPQTAVSSALPSIQAGLGVTTGALAWVIDAFVLALAAFIMLSGTLGERYGHKKVLVAGLVLICAGSLTGLCSGSSVRLLWTAQAILGLAAAALMASSLAVVSHAVPDPRRRAQAIGAWASCLAIGLVAGPWLSTLVLDAAGAGWPWIFAALAPTAVAGLLFAGPGVQETPRRPGRSLDAPGQFAAALAIAALVFAVIEGPTAGWGSTRVVTGFAVAALAGAGFTLRERRASTPMLDLRLFRSREFSVTGIVAVLVMFGLIGMLFLLSLFFGGVQHESEGAIALRFSIINGPVIVTGPLAARMARRLAPQVPLVLGLVLAGAGILSLTVLNPTSALAVLWWRLAAIGAGFGLVLASMTAIAVGSVPPALMSMAGAASNTLRQTGAALGPAVLGAVVTSRVAGILPGALASRHVHPATASRARVLLGQGGLHALERLPRGPERRVVVASAGRAFTDGVHLAAAVSGAALLAAALLALVALRTGREPERTPAVPAPRAPAGHQQQPPGPATTSATP